MRARIAERAWDGSRAISAAPARAVRTASSRAAASASATRATIEPSYGKAISTERGDVRHAPPIRNGRGESITDRWHCERYSLCFPSPASPRLYRPLPRSSAEPMPNVTVLLDARTVPESRVALVHPARGVEHTYASLRAEADRVGAGLARARRPEGRPGLHLPGLLGRVPDRLPRLLADRRRRGPDQHRLPGARAPARGRRRGGRGRDRRRGRGRGRPGRPARGPGARARGRGRRSRPGGDGLGGVSGSRRPGCARPTAASTTSARSSTRPGRPGSRRAPC